MSLHVRDTIAKRYFGIDEVSKAIGENQTKIRYWIQQFGIDTMRRYGIRRRFTVDELGQIALISRLVKYMHISAAKRIFYRGQGLKILEILEPWQKVTVQETVREGVPMYIEPR